MHLLPEIVSLVDRAPHSSLRLARRRQHSSKLVQATGSFALTQVLKVHDNLLLSRQPAAYIVINLTLLPALCVRSPPYPDTSARSPLRNEITCTRALSDATAISSLQGLASTAASLYLVPVFPTGTLGTCIGPSIVPTFRRYVIPG